MDVLSGRFLGEDWIRAIPIAAVSAAVAVLVTQKLSKPKPWVNHSIQKNNPKVATSIDVEDIGDGKAYCRCWRSKQVSFGFGCSFPCLCLAWGLRCRWSLHMSQERSPRMQKTSTSWANAPTKQQAVQAFRTFLEPACKQNCLFSDSCTWMGPHTSLTITF